MDWMRPARAVFAANAGSGKLTGSNFQLEVPLKKENL
jgi:hypothetical protein